MLHGHLAVLGVEAPEAHAHEHTHELVHLKLCVRLGARHPLAALVCLEEEWFHQLEGERRTVVGLESHVDHEVVELLDRHGARGGRVLRLPERLGVRAEDGGELAEDEMQRLMHLFFPQGPAVDAVEPALPERLDKRRMLSRRLSRQRPRFGEIEADCLDRGALEHACLLGRLAHQVAHEREDLLPVVHLLDGKVLGDGAARDALDELVEAQHRLRRVCSCLADAELLDLLRVHEGGLARRHREAALDLRAARRRISGDLRELLHLPLPAQVRARPLGSWLVGYADRFEPFLEAELRVVVG